MPDRRAADKASNRPVVHRRDVEAAVEAAGFTVLGTFNFLSDDADVPRTANGTPAKALALVGNAGPSMWRHYKAERHGVHEILDAWTERALARVASGLVATVLFPFSKPPLPFQRWAARSGQVHTSPLGLSIHPEYGLWHAYRAALLFAGATDFSEAESPPSPCDTCAGRPCLNTCPVGAFTGTAYRVPDCVQHISTQAGSDCMELGCRARRACPVGQAYVYEPEQAHFHMSAFARALRQVD